MTEEFMESFAKGIRGDKKNTNIAALKWQIGDQENPNFNLTGYRADKEPDATWHRPSNHRPPHISPEEAEYRSRASGNAGNYPHIFNPDVECREDDYIPQEQPSSSLLDPKPDETKQPQGNPNIWKGKDPGIFCRKTGSTWECRNVKNQVVPYPSDFPYR